MESRYLQRSSLGWDPDFRFRNSSHHRGIEDESRGGTSSSQSRLRSYLVTGEIAISLILLVAGGLMLQSLRTLLRRIPAPQPGHLLTFQISLPDATYTPSQKHGLTATSVACVLSTNLSSGSALCLA